MISPQRHREFYDRQSSLPLVLSSVLLCVSVVRVVDGRDAAHSPFTTEAQRNTESFTIVKVRSHWCFPLCSSVSPWFVSLIVGVRLIHHSPTTILDQAIH